MSYERLPARLADRPSPTVATLPDGSIDQYCTLTAGAVGPIRTRATLGREIEDPDRSTFRMHIDTTEPGGQAVNVATQLDAIGADVTCYGHLDDPLFDTLDFETVSMGGPATVYAFNFADSDVMFVEGSVGEDWTLEDLTSITDLTEVFAVDAVSCANWVSFPGLGPAFHELATRELPRIPFILDPGDIVGSDPSAIGALRDAIASLQETFDVVYNANRQEIRATAATLEDPPADDRDRLAAIRSATGITATVLHAPEEAIAATPDGITAVDSLHVSDPARHTGGGDRFTGGLAYGLAAGWDWELALACGNACAARYVETGRTPDLETLAAFVRDRRP
ncbi:MAG: PfkB family carbohydrate kinase [Halobacteriaceae archaeon]